MPAHETPAERYLAPFSVLALQFLLLADVSWHHKELLQLGRARDALEWAVAAAAVLTYLATVAADPGFLKVATAGIGSSQPRPAGVLSLMFGGCCAVIAGVFGCCPHRRKEEAESPVNAGGTSIQKRDMKAAQAVELQPIGRSVLNAVASTEADDDPGEETIDLADIEKGASFVTKQVDSAPERRPKLREKQGKAQVYWKERYLAPDTSNVTQSGQKLRYCKVCCMHQPLRTKHCRDCGRCVRTHDHHCPWVGTCIAEGNRVYFFWFLVAQWIELVVFIAESILEIAKDGFNPRVWLGEYSMLILGVVIMSFLLVMVTCLLCFHSYLAMTNITTWESMSWHNISYLRSLPPEDGSPFSTSLRANLATYCCLPVCPDQGCCGGSPAPVKLTEDGWAVWDLVDQHAPLAVCGRRICQCFDAE